MKKIKLVLFIILCVNAVSAQIKISIEDVSKHIGDSVTVCSQVFGTKATEKITYINLGAAYPVSPLTIIIFAKDNANFKDAPSSLYSNKKLCVTGTIKDYKGKIEIIVTKPEDISISE